MWGRLLRLVQPAVSRTRLEPLRRGGAEKPASYCITRSTPHILRQHGGGDGGLLTRAYHHHHHQRCAPGPARDSLSFAVPRTMALGLVHQCCTGYGNVSSLRGSSAPLSRRAFHTSASSAAMFGSLSSALSGFVSRFSRRTDYTTKELDELIDSFRDILIDSDVALVVVDSLISSLRAKISAAIQSSPKGQSPDLAQFIREELILLLGGSNPEVELRLPPKIQNEGQNSTEKQGPSTLLMVGVQGSGKTTTCAKLAVYLQRSQRLSVLLVSVDTSRPAAQDQLQLLAEQGSVACYPIHSAPSALAIAQSAMAHARANNFDLVMFDTAGRLGNQDALMAELAQLRELVRPLETLLVVDAMIGQDAIRMATDFSQVGCSGVVMTRIDGDSRGGGPLSVCAALKLPIKFIGTGERLADIEKFVPRGIVDRMLGLGDLGSFMELAKTAVDPQTAKMMVNPVVSTTYDFNQYYKTNIVPVNNVAGGATTFASYLPKGNVGGTARIVSDERVAALEGNFYIHEKLIRAMTPEQRANPSFLNNSVARQKLADAAGQPLSAVLNLVREFERARTNYTIFLQHARKGRDVAPGIPKGEAATNFVAQSQKKKEELIAKKREEERAKDRAKHAQRMKQKKR
eukprot:gnl/Spiro4/13395_TR7138_c0_g1_i1.p1 gnl/Spiro4/13395_TR7138_c0_g1~~gnl/Spiro4/13395_TR7138_c0_g1_i1.p1  ORF type:complete len:640 (+),score=133.28 gnl/Spiro4/13395_TR7138_c0_g1_i1:32-1921(+)